METINVAFGLEIRGIQFNGIDFSDTVPEFKNITLKPVDKSTGKYELLVKKNVFSTSEDMLRTIFKEARAEVDNFRYIFSVAADVKIFDLECLGYYCSGKLYEYYKIFPGASRWGLEAFGTVTAGTPTINKIKEKIKKRFDLKSLQMFYDAATIIEPIGRFISLYTALLHHCNDRQKNLDKAILAVDPTIAQFKNPDPEKTWEETSFTKLRNELSHKRDGINLLDTHNKIKANLDRFEKIVKQIIVKEPE